ncbi:hypothetical protein TNCT_70601 [Trichonephila clavata]|uniref:Uncharacterized protein n=1 Tax=Trichonephila clavata TaxID=2740835 RepID=A0A8X6IQ48_TRICU|nr:hypothetical protein TNCT_70601 [Trichonephila clavata]
MADKIMPVYNPIDISSTNEHDQSRTISCSCEDNFPFSSSIEASIESLTQQISLNFTSQIIINLDIEIFHEVVLSLEIPPTDCVGITIVLERMHKPL